MKKVLIIILSLISILIFYGYTNINNGTLRGFYQSERTSEGYIIQISIQPDENSFVQYIDNREVNNGTYNELDNNKYALVGEDKTIEISLDRNNSFKIISKKINGGNPIVMKNVAKVPAYFSTEFDDITKYKELLQE